MLTDRQMGAWCVAETEGHPSKLEPPGTGDTEH